MINDPELKAMSEVYEALQDLDGSTQRRVLDWVLAKLESSPSVSGTTGTNGGPKPRSKRVGKNHGPKPGSKRKSKRGRPPGSKNISTKLVAKSPGRRGRPRKTSEV